jgi:hypothetical protein
MYLPFAFNKKALWITQGLSFPDTDLHGINTAFYPLSFLHKQESSFDADLSSIVTAKED